MAETPSARRRKGRDAYYRGADADYHCPYRDEYKARDWHEGWRESEKADRAFADEQAKRSELASLPISFAIDVAEASDDVKEILRRIAEHVGME